MTNFFQIYCWEGVHSIKVDRDAALTAACHLSEETNAQLVKASQGREPPHLLQIYDGKLKILAGRHRDSRKVSLFNLNYYLNKIITHEEIKK